MGAGCARSFAKSPKCTGRSCSKKRSKGSAARSRSRILRRLVAYARKRFDLFALLGRLKDRRLEPRIPTSRVVNSAVMMYVGRLSSFNALEQTIPSKIWKHVMGGKPPSADTMGRVCEGLDPEEIRPIHTAFYQELKRAKALPPFLGGLTALVLDAHESTASYRRRCDDCLTRTVHTESGDRVQYFHRFVAAMLITGTLRVWVDAEPIRAHEDEVAAAKRLLQRVYRRQGRSFDVVLADSLYARADFFQAVLDLGKNVVTVLKQENRELTVDARALFEEVQQQSLERGRTQCECWDVEGLTSWSTLKRAVRVVRSVETRHVRRQLDNQIEKQTVEWIWVTTLSQSEASTKLIVELGHARWSIENQGFNELVNHFGMDHVCHHEPTAMLVLLLLGMLAYNLVHAFYERNLKAVCRARWTLKHVVQLISGEIYSNLPSPAPS